MKTRLKVAIMLVLVTICIVDIARHGFGEKPPHSVQETEQRANDISQGTVPVSPTAPITFPVTPKELP